MYHLNKTLCFRKDAAFCNIILTVGTVSVQISGLTVCTIHFFLFYLISSQCLSQNSNQRFISRKKHGMFFVSFLKMMSPIRYVQSYQSFSGTRYSCNETDRFPMIFLAVFNDFINPRSCNCNIILIAFLIGNFSYIVPRV